MTATTPIVIDASDLDQTSEIQAAIDTAAETVEVRLAAGRHASRGLRLRSGATLWLDEGASLEFETTYEAYASNEVEIEAEQSNRAMITAQGAKGIVIGGKGRIFCNGSTDFSIGDDHEMGTRIPDALRPRVLVLDKCEDVSIHGIRVEDSPMWTLHFVDCDRLRIRDLNIDNDRRMPNTDGIVIDGCRDVEITNCEIRTADDGVVLKTSARADGTLTGTCSDINVHHCLIESRSCALKIGTESFSDFRNIRFEDCTIEKSNRGLGIFSRDGGMVDGIYFHRITLDCTETPDGFWGSGEALTITSLSRRPHQKTAGAVCNVSVSEIKGRHDGAINFYAEEPGMIRDVRLDGIALEQTVGALGTAQRYDIRPTPADLEPSPDAAGRINAWRKGPDGRVIGLIDYPEGMPALFAMGVTNLDLGDLEFARPEPLPEGWNSKTVVLA